MDSQNKKDLPTFIVIIILTIIIIIWACVKLYDGYEIFDVGETEATTLVSPND